MANASEINLIYNGAEALNPEWEGKKYTGYQWKLSRTESAMSLFFRDSNVSEWATCDLSDIPPEDFRIISEAIQAALKIEF